jgi:hypothetical protein
MNERFTLYLTYMGYNDVVSGWIILFVSGLMGVWYVCRVSPIPALRKISGMPFWTITLLLYLVVFACLTFFWPKG